MITSNCFLNAHREQRESGEATELLDQSHNIRHTKITLKLSLSVDYVVGSSLITEGGMKTYVCVCIRVSYGSCNL